MTKTPGQVAYETYLQLLGPEWMPTWEQLKDIGHGQEAWESIALAVRQQAMEEAIDSLRQSGFIDPRRVRKERPATDSEVREWLG